MNDLRIDEEQFMKMNEKDQNLILYRNLNRIEQKIKRKAKVDGALSTGSGFVGGMFAVIGKWFFFKA